MLHFNVADPCIEFNDIVQWLKDIVREYYSFGVQKKILALVWIYQHYRHMHRTYTVSIEIYCKNVIDKDKTKYLFVFYFQTLQTHAWDDGKLCWHWTIWSDVAKWDT